MLDLILNRTDLQTNCNLTSNVLTEVVHFPLSGRATGDHEEKTIYTEKIESCGD